LKYCKIITKDNGRSIKTCGVIVSNSRCTIKHEKVDGVRIGRSPELDRWSIIEQNNYLLH
jgi:hypothetical protein